MSEAPVPTDKIIPLSGESGDTQGRGVTRRRSSADTVTLSAIPGNPGASQLVSPAQIPFATEAGHWYKQDGTPFYTIIGLTTGKPRPVTLKDARKLGLVPSVTTVTSLIKGEGLINYIRKQVFEATLKCPFALKDETPEAHLARALAMAEQHKEKAAERGTSLHGEIEHFLLGQEVSQKWIEHVRKLVERLHQSGIDLHFGSPEKSFAHPLGYGGKCDWHKSPLIHAAVEATQYDPWGSPTDAIVIDFKSKDFIEPGKKYAYDEHAMQIASYAVGLGLSLRTVRGINVFIGEQDQRILVHEWPTPDLESAWEQFRLLLRIWQIRKKYCPAFGVEEKE